MDRGDSRLVPREGRVDGEIDVEMVLFREAWSASATSGAMRTEI
jgi:hypothetical protein